MYFNGLIQVCHAHGNGFIHRYNNRSGHHRAAGKLDFDRIGSRAPTP